MAIKDKIRDRKLKYGIKREAAKASALWSDKSDKCECLTGEEMLLFDQSGMIKAI